MTWRGGEGTLRICKWRNLRREVLAKEKGKLTGKEMYKLILERKSERRLGKGQVMNENIVK